MRSFGHYPFGELWYETGTVSKWKFTTYERDSESTNDYAMARYHVNRFGRWLSADWSSVPVPVPYANLTNPQTLNLYSMVADDPESFADLDGHQNNSQGGADAQSAMNNQVNCNTGTAAPGTCTPPPPAQATASAETVIAAFYRFGEYLAALGAVGNAAKTVTQNVKETTDVAGFTQLGNRQIDTHGETSTVVGPPAVGAGVTVTVDKPRPDQTVLAQPGVSLTPAVQVSINVVQDPNGKVHTQGVSVTAQASSPGPKWLPVSVAVPDSAFSRLANAVQKFLGLEPAPNWQIAIDPSNGGRIWY